MIYLQLYEPRVGELIAILVSIFFSNLERLKEDAEWEEDTQSWKLPELTRIKLPPASGRYIESFSIMFIQNGIYI